MIKKFIIKGVSKKFKGLQKLKPQKTPSRFTSVMSEATVKANQRKVLGDVPEYMGLSSRSIGDLASESLALRTANKTFFKSLGKGLKQSRARTATGIKTFRQTKKVPNFYEVPMVLAIEFSRPRARRLRRQMRWLTDTRLCLMTSECPEVNLRPSRSQFSTGF